MPQPTALPRLQTARSDPLRPPGRSVYVALVVLSVVAATGCATKGDLRDVQGEIRALSAHQDSVLVELQRQGRTTVDTLRTQSDQLVDLRGNVSQSLRQILRELEALRELAGQNQRTIASLRDQVGLLQRSVRTGVAPTEGSPGPMGEAPSESAESMYSAAMSSFNRGSSRAAEMGFVRFIRQFPDHELTPLAHFNLASTYAEDGRFQDAIEEFSKIPERFPTSDRVPQALYRIGLIYLNDLDDPGEGRRFLERVVNTYPDSPAAPLAERALAGSGGGASLP